MGGMTDNLSSPFTVLNTYTNYDLDVIARDYGIDLGDETETNDNINAIKLEDIARAALAETIYNIAQGKRLANSHAIEGENLTLSQIDNKLRGGGGETGQPAKRKE
jgi:hypothetical protein